LCLESESGISPSKYLLQRLKNRPIVKCDLPLLQSTRSDHQPGHYCLQYYFLLSLTDLPGSPTDTLIEQLYDSLTEPPAGETPQLHQDSKHPHYVLARVHVALTHQTQAQLLDHMRDYFTRQVSRVDVYHGYQCTVHEGLVREVGEG
jgi:hypothetical protein